MKRPVTLVLVASLLVSASSFAGTNEQFRERIAEKVAKSENARAAMIAVDNRGNDRRGNDRRTIIVATTTAATDRGNDESWQRRSWQRSSRQRSSRRRSSQ